MLFFFYLIKEPGFSVPETFIDGGLEVRNFTWPDLYVVVLGASMGPCWVSAGNGLCIPELQKPCKLKRLSYLASYMFNQMVKTWCGSYWLDCQFCTVSCALLFLYLCGLGFFCYLSSLSELFLLRSATPWKKNKLCWKCLLRTAQPRLLMQSSDILDGMRTVEMYE